MTITKKGTILFIGNFLSRKTGVRSISEELTEELRNRDWNILTVSKFQQRVSKLLDLILSTIKYQRFIDVAHIEVYSGRAFRWSELASIILRFYRKPFILTLHGGRLVEFSNRNPNRVRNLLSSTSYITTPSRFLQEHFLKFGTHIEYIPNGISLSKYKFVQRKHPKPRLCWLRSMHDIYNPISAVTSISYLVDEFPNVELIMAGPDRYDGTLENLKRAVCDLKLYGNVSVTGPIVKANVPTWLSKHDVFINTTRYESFGVSVMEAAAVGLPIVTTSVGEIPYLWQHRTNAMLVPVDDPLAVAEAVRSILRFGDLSSTLSINGRKTAEKYDWEVLVPQWEELYKEVITNG